MKPTAHLFRPVLCVGIAVAALVAPATARAGVGGLDPTFGKGGIATTPLGAANRSRVELGVGPDGSAVVGNLFGSGYLVRFDPGGSPDAGFGEAGRLTLGRDPLSEGVAERAFFPRDFGVDDQGRLLVFGSESDSRHGYRVPNVGAATGGPLTAFESRAVVLRLTPEGQPDLSFGAGKGFFRSSLGLRSRFHTDIPLIDSLGGAVDSRDRPVFVVGAQALALDPHAAGTIGSYPRAIVRLTQTGEIDRSFGGNGVTPITGSTDFPALGIDGSDRPAISVGPCLRQRLDCSSDTALVRLRGDGRRMQRFGDRGTRTFKELLRLAFIAPSGAMFFTHPNGRTLQVVSVGLSGQPDRGFGNEGAATVPLPAAAGNHVRPVAVDAQGRILLAGFLGRTDAFGGAAGPKQASLVVGRLLPDGRMDRSFGEDGWILDRLPERLEVGSTAASLDPQGRLLLAATVAAPDQSEGGYLLARYLLGP